MNKKKEIKNKNQHYVPQYYFRFFSSDEVSIRMLLRKNGRVTPCTAISTQSSDDYFYGDENIENEITNFDTKYSINHGDLIRHLNDGQFESIQNSTIDILIENILFQRQRTLSYRESNTKIRDFYRDFFKPQIEDLDNYDSGHSKEATLAIKEVMKKIFLSFSDPKDTQYFELTRVQEQKKEISDLKIIFLHNKTGKPFVFSDSPVVYSNLALQDYRCSKLGEINLGLQIFFPLNPSWMVFLYDQEAYQIKNNLETISLNLTDEHDISEINKLQIHESFNSIYFENAKHAPYLEKLWKEEKNKLRRQENNINLVPEITLNGVLTGREIYSISAPEPLFYPELSFLQLKDLSASHIPYRFGHIVRKTAGDIEIENFNHLIDRFSDTDDKARG